VGCEKEDNLIATCNRVSFEENPCFDVSFSREDMGETSLKSAGKKCNMHSAMGFLQSRFLVSSMQTSFFISSCLQGTGWQCA